jgi:outer membrane lipoprotein
MYSLALFCVGAALLLQGCSYAISPDFSRKADKSITFEQLQADPSAFQGRVVVLGGVIARTTGVKSGTLIEVIQKELDYWGKPRRTEKTGGTFLVFHAGHLDPAAYAPGREITVAGEVTVAGQILPGEAPDYPLIAAKEMRLWELSQPGPEKPMWMDRLYDPDAPGGKFGY